MKRRTALVAAALLPLLVLGTAGAIRGLTKDALGSASPAATDSILNPHPAAGPFTADETAIDECAATSDDRRVCLEQAFGNLAYRTSGKQALAVMAERGASTPEIAAGCHRIAHTIGAAVLARENGDAAAALAEGDSTCWSGFYHGLLERALAPARSTGELGRLLRTLCEPTSQNWARFTLYQCLHGLGHGLMLRTGNALEASLDLCTRLNDEWSRQSCYGGAFMESFSPSLANEPPPFDAADPLAPCPSVAETFKYYCYLQVADNLVRATDYTWEDVARGCAAEPESRWRAVCFQGYGRQASGSNYGAPAAVATLCAVPGATGEGECVYGAARDIASNAASGRPAGAFCRLVVEKHRARCFEGVGTIVSNLELDRGAIRARCAELARTFATACLSGAGLSA